jgi:hypothetical protein
MQAAADLAFRKGGALRDQIRSPCRPCCIGNMPNAQRTPMSTSLPRWRSGRCWCVNHAMVRGGLHLGDRAFSALHAQECPAERGACGLPRAALRRPPRAAAHFGQPAAAWPREALLVERQGCRFGQTAAAQRDGARLAGHGERNALLAIESQALPARSRPVAALREALD